MPHKRAVNFFVYRRSLIEAMSGHDEPHIIISITSPFDEPARLPVNEHTRGVLRLAFWDHRDEHPPRPGRPGPMFTEDMAREIWAFIGAHRDVERIVVHCDEGRSRSPGVAAALAKVLTGDDSEIRRQYHPNSRVYRILLETAPSV